MSLASQSLASLRQQLNSGDITSRDIVEDVISQIDSRDGEIGAFLSLDPESALAAADQANHPSCPNLRKRA